MERSTKGETVNEKRGYSSAGPAETRVKSRAATPNNSRSFRSSLKGSLKGSMKGILKGKPSSLVFAAADSESDSDHRARHHCSFSSRGGASPEIMDLRLLDSVHGRRSSYELSVCSAGSIESMQTNDEKMHVIEVTPASLKKEGDEEKSGGLIQALKARRRFSMETIWSTHKKAIPKGTSVASSLGDPIESSVTHKNPRKVRARRCAQATVILVVLAMIVVLPWLVITIYFGVEGNDPTSLISSITAKIPGMIEGLFDPRDDEEVHHEQAGKPPLVSARNTENRLLMRERIPIDRQTRIEAKKKD